MKKIDPALYERLAALVSALGCELIGCELLSQGKRALFRLYIDKEPAGVSVEDCSNVSRQVSALLDVEGPLHGRYNLEVSSPGINRPLFERAHFEKYIGKRVNIKLHTLINQQRHYQGVLLRVEGDQIHILPDGSSAETILSLQDIDKANLIGDVRF